MNKILLFLIVLSLSYLQGQNNCNSGRYYSEVFSNTQSTGNIQFGAADPYGILNNQNLFLDIVAPVGDTLAKRPLVLHQFGGGFLIGWRTEPVIPQMAEMYAKRGFVFATIDYRLGFNPLNGQSAERAVYRAGQDLRAALRFLVDNADLYGIDTSAIFLTGTSAGCLAAFVSTYMNESDRVNIPSTYGILFEPEDLGCVNCSGNNNFNNQEPRVHGIVNNWGAMLDTSYIDIATDPADNVPVISFHGTNDAIVPYVEGNPFSLPIFPYVQGSYLIHQRLDNLGIKNKLFPLQGLGHEPQLLQLQTWVTDTIIRQGSKFLYEIMYGDSIQIIGDASHCINDTATYALPLHLGSQYCWNILGGSLITQNQNVVTIVWNTLGTHQLIGYELDKREISKQAILDVEIGLPPYPMISFTSYDGLFNFSSSTSANTYEWNFGDGSSGLGLFLQHQYLDTGFFLMSLQVENDYCAISKDTLIASTLCPNASFAIIQNDSMYTFVNSSVFGSQALWITDDGSIITGNSFTVNFTTEGNYNLSLISSNAYCSDTLTQNISINFCSQADFSFSANQLTVQFSELTYNTYFYNWNFGDGAISALPNPSHNYASPGTYNVSLITNSLQACPDTSTKQVMLDLGSPIQEQNLQNISITPNPFTDILIIKGLDLQQSYTYEVYTMHGQLAASNTIQSKTIKLSSLSKGIYFLKIQDSCQNTFKQIILKH
jgi:PKD repeat protein/acetyl esterase/lipase